MSDGSDDWMHPSKSTAYVLKPAVKGKIDYLIERQRRVVCFGNPGYVLEWDLWRSFDTAKQRDEEFDKLRKEHPSWVLKKRNRDEYMENLTRRAT